MSNALIKECASSHHRPDLRMIVSPNGSIYPDESIRVVLIVLGHPLQESRAKHCRIIKGKMLEEKKINSYLF